MVNSSRLKGDYPHDGLMTYFIEYPHMNSTIQSGASNFTHGEYTVDFGLELLIAGYTINKYYLWFIFAFGFPGNLATLITVCRMRHLGSFVIYVALLAIIDNLAIAVKILFYQLLLNNIALGSVGCRILEFLGNFLITYCNWILVLMAIERLIAVRYPFKVHFQSCLTSQKAAVAIAVVGLVIAGMCIPVLWASDYTDDNNIAVCSKDNTELMRAISWILVSLYAFIPFIILAVCNFLIAREIRVSFRLRGTFSHIQNLVLNRRTCDVPVQRQIMLMLFTATFMFLLLHFPICAFLVANSYWEVQEHTRPYAIKYFCQQLAFVLCDSNHAFNFYLYFLSARKFRKHFTHMVVSGIRKCKCACSCFGTCKKNIERSQTQSKRI